MLVCAGIEIKKGLCTNATRTRHANVKEFLRLLGVVRDGATARAWSGIFRFFDVGVTTWESNLALCESILLDNM